MYRKGSVVIVSILVIAFALIGISAVLASTYLTGFSMQQSDFRQTVTQVASSSRGAIAIGMAQVSELLSQRVKTSSPYYDGSTISSTSYDANEGLTILQSCQNNIMQSYPTVGLVLNYVNPFFSCNWTGRTGYSVSGANVSIDLLNLGFKGLKNQVSVQTNATINNLVDTDGNLLSFTVTFMGEGNNPIDNMDQSLIHVYYAGYIYNSTYRKLQESTVNSIEYLNGDYLVNCTNNLNTIDTNINNVISGVNSLQDTDFNSTDPSSTRNIVIDKLNTVEAKYSSYHSITRNQTLLSDAFNLLLYEVRPMMDPSSPSSVRVIYPTANTTSILQGIDSTLGQLQPTVRVLGTDFRGITVGAYGACGLINGNLPLVLKEKVVTGTGGNYILTATADDRKSGNDKIVQAEYYISDSLTTKPQNAVSHSMSAVDGTFNQPVEAVTATVYGIDLYPTNNYLWIRAKDAKGYWSDYAKVKITSLLHMKSIDAVGNVYIIMQGHSSGSGSNTLYWVTGKVLVVDGNGTPQMGVTVQGTWSGSYSYSGTATSLGGGYYSFETTHQKYNGNKVYTFTLQITNIKKTGYTWTDPTQSDTEKLLANKTWNP
jgi:hypothetical protein